MSDAKTLAAILLVAGPSTRLGQPKQLVRFEGEALARRTARLLADLDRVHGNIVAVTGFQAADVAAEFTGLPVKAVLNDEWEKGMGGSIACGARCVPGATDGILVSVCDQWLLTPGDMQKLVDSWTAAPSRIHIASWKEGEAYVSGPPVIFPGRLCGELRGLEKTRGARQVIDRYMDNVEFVELESAAFDLDRPEDLCKLLNHPA
jgi:molybdenum cofactor cytidylyltransferase